MTVKVLKFSVVAITLTVVLPLRSEQLGVSETPAAQSGVIRVVAPSVVEDVIVTDKKGAVVQKLQASDFAIYEDNVPQKIVAFEPPPKTSSGAERIGRTSERTSGGSAARITPSGPQPTDKSETLGLAGAHFVTLILDLGDLQPANLKASCDAIARYLEKDMPLEDFVGIYWIGHNNLRMGLPFSRDRDRALEVVRGLEDRTASGYVTAQERIETEQEVSDLQQQERIRQQDDPSAARLYHNYRMALQADLYMQSTFQARAIFQALRAIAQALSALPGRKNVVVFTEGFIHSPEAAAQMASVIDAANRANVAFYVIDAKGLTTGHTGEIMSAENRAAGESVSHGNLLGPPEPATEATQLNEMASAKPESVMGVDKLDWAARIGSGVLTEDLEQIAYGTGGVFISNQNNLYAGLQKVNTDLSDYYTLVYQPAKTNYDGSFRRVRVELKRRGYQLRYRVGYWAIPPGDAVTTTPAAAQLIQTVLSGSFRPSLGVSMNAALLFSSDGSWAVPISASVPGEAVPLDKRDGAYRGGVKFVATVSDGRGHALGVFQRFFDLNFNEGQYEDLRKSKLRLTARLSIPKSESVTVEGIVQLSHGEIGTALRRVTLPLAQTSGPVLSSLVLTNDVVQTGEPGQDDADPLRVSNLELGLPAEPRFSASDKLTAYFGIADIPMDPDTDEPRLRFCFAIKAGNQVLRNLPAKEIDHLPPRAPARLQVIRQYDLGGLGPGHYTLEVVVEDLVGHASLSESAPFTID